MQANKFKTKCSKIFYVSKVRRSELEYVYAGCLHIVSNGWSAAGCVVFKVFLKLPKF